VVVAHQDVERMSHGDFAREDDREHGRCGAGVAGAVHVLGSSDSTPGVVHGRTVLGPVVPVLVSRCSSY